MKKLQLLNGRRVQRVIGLFVIIIKSATIKL